MERRLAAILAADVVGYSRLMSEDEVRTLDALKSHRKDLFEPKEVQYHGRTIKLMGDGALMEFGSVVDAVQFAIEVQLAMRERNAGVPENEQIVFRIGINVGDIIVEGQDIYGDGVNVAARLEALAPPGGVCVRRNVRNQVRDKLAIDFDDLGEVEVKNITRPVRVFRIVFNEKAELLATPVVPIPATQTRKQWKAIASILALGALVAIGVSFYWQPWAPSTDRDRYHQATERTSIAVLPFANIGGDPERDYFADGLTADLITDLSKISGLFVIARNSVFTYKGRAVNVQQVAEDLGVRYILEGSVRQSGNNIRINVLLVDASNGQQLWAERYNRDQDEIFKVQDEVLGRIVSALSVQLTDQEERQLARIPTRNLEAYDHYLRAEKGAYSSDFALITESIKRYKKAIALDQEFAEAHAGLARTFADVLLYDIGTVAIGPVARDAAYSAASRATELNPDLPRPLSVLAIVQAIDGEHDNAVKLARRAVKLAPGNAEAFVNLALVLGTAGDPNGAVNAVEKALRINPIPPPGYLLIAGLTHYLARNYEEAAGYTEKARKTIPISVMVLDVLAMTYAQLDRLDDARTFVSSVLQELDEGYSLSGAQVFYGHYKREQDRTHIVDGLRKAGLPRWPLGFEGHAQDRLNGTKIEEIVLGQTWTGRFLKTESFFLSFDQDGSFALRTQNTIRVGNSKIQDDELCLKSPSHHFGRWLCGPVFSNPKSSQTDELDYVYGAGSWHFEFALEK